MTTRTGTDDGQDVIAQAAKSTVASLFVAQARLHPQRIALVDGSDDARTVSYGALDDRSCRLANVLAARGVGRGDRIALLSENRREVPEVFLAAARLGAIVACQNWRLSAREIEHCVRMVAPREIVVSPRHGDLLQQALGATNLAPLVLGAGYESLLAAASADHALGADVDPEDPLLILYTSGTTGLPKGAVISHRAQIVRNLVVRAEFALAPDDTFVAWSPLYHMGAVDCALGALMSGGKVIVVGGFDPDQLAEVVQREELGWLC